MNVLMISSDGQLMREGSPVEKRLLSYAAHMDELHVVLVGRGEREIDRVVAPNLWIYDRRTRFGLRSFPWAVRAAKVIVAKRAIDVVSAQSPFEHGWVARRAVKRTKAKLHLQVHTDYLSPWFTRGRIYRSPRVRMPVLNRIRIRLADRVVPHADGIRVVSERIKRSMQERYGAMLPEPSVIPIQVDPNVPPREELPPRPFSFTLIAVSRLEAEKRVDDLLACVKRLEDGYPSLGLVLVGDGSERKRLERRARRLGISDRVLFLGWRKDAWGLMQSANAFIQASAYEGYGISLIEAALAGVPIVTSDVGIVGEVFVGYEQVLSAPVGDPTNLAALTAQLIEDQQARSLLALEARRAALLHLASVKNSPADIVADIGRTLAHV